MTPEVLSACTGARIDRARLFAAFLTSAMVEYDITTPAEQSMFLAQVGHESGGLRWTTELWGAMPTAAQARYEGRVDLGNVQPGDGYKFRGRGLLQTTGRANYKRAGFALGADLETFPDLLAEPGMASRSAALYWQNHGLNEWAGDIAKVTRKINGGLNGLAERTKLWNVAKTALGVSNA